MIISTLFQLMLQRKKKTIHRWTCCHHFHDTTCYQRNSMTWWRYPLSLSTYISKTARSPFFIIEFLISWIWQSLKNSVYGIQSHLKSASEGKKDLIISNQGLWQTLFSCGLKQPDFWTLHGEWYSLIGHVAEFFVSFRGVF